MLIHYQWFYIAPLMVLVPPIPAMALNMKFNRHWLGLYRTNTLFEFLPYTFQQCPLQQKKSINLQYE